MEVHINLKKFDAIIATLFAVTGMIQLVIKTLGILNPEVEMSFLVVNVCLCCVFAGCKFALLAVAK